MTDMLIQRYLAKTEANLFVPAWVGPGPTDLFLSMETELYRVSLASSVDEVREAQQLRFQVFSQEYGAVFHGPEKGFDQDEFDDYCDHIIVRDRNSMRIVGTYRVLLPEQARKIGGYYSQREFSLIRLQRFAPDLVELGRSCVHPDHRTGAVIMLLWKAIAQYMRRHHCRYLVGCASVSMRDGGAQAVSLWQHVQRKAEIDPALQAYPRTRLPLECISPLERFVEPPLLRAYLSMGAVICSEPSWDPDFNTADFLMFLDLANIHPRYAKHFGLNDLFSSNQ